MQELTDIRDDIIDARRKRHGRDSKAVHGMHVATARNKLHVR